MKFPHYMILGAAIAVPMGAGAASINGKSAVMCATLEAVQCVHTTGSQHVCARGVAHGLNVPQFLRVDFEGNQITATPESGINKTSAIGSVSRGNGHIVVQGVDDGHGWSLVMEENTGRMTASAIGDEEGLLVFGACTQL